MWKNKLEDTSALSFATLQNKDAAWEKLQSRFVSKPKKKIAAWYWIAAACIVIAATIPFFTTQPVKDVTQHASSINNDKKTFNKKDEPVKNIASEFSIKNQSKKPLQQNNNEKINKQKNIVIDSSNIIAITNNNQQSSSENIISPVINDTNSIAVITQINNQKKLKVVHVNELGEPAEFPADVAHTTTNLHLFQLKLAQQEIYNASSTAANNNNSGFSFKPKKLSN